jgi:Na+-driven multidrug efflux pump
LLVKAIGNKAFPIVSFFTPSTFQTGADASLTGNGGWNGVVLSSLLAYLCYFALAYLLVFLNNVFAGAYRKRTPSDVI